MQIEIKNLMIDIVSGCNLNCKHCYNRTTVDCADMLSLDDIDLIISKTNLYGLQRVYLTGGEPLLHPNIEEILKFLVNKYRHLEIGITTNGLLLTEQMLEKIEGCGNIVIQISVDATNKEMYEAIRGDNTFERFIRGFNVLKASTTKKKTARTCVSSINVQDVENIYRMCVDSHIEPSFLFVTKMGNAEENWNELKVDDAKKLSVVNQINALNNEYGLHISAPIPTYKCNFTQLIDRERCDCGAWGLSVQANGNVTCCQFLYDYPIGNIFKDSIEAMFNGICFNMVRESAVERKKRLLEASPCKDCFLKEQCGLGCMGAAISRGDILGLDDQCMYRRMYALFKGCNFISR